MSERLEEMLRIAQAATKGPWVARYENPMFPHVADIDGEGWRAFATVCVVFDNKPDSKASKEGRANAQHIATFNPRTAKALVRGMQVLQIIASGTADDVAPYRSMPADTMRRMARMAMADFYAAMEDNNGR